MERRDQAAAQDRGPCQRVGEDPGSAPRGASANSGNPLKGSAREHPAATTEREWALFLGDRIVTRYETREDAADSMAWYIETYGAASEPLTIGEVDAT